MIRISAHSDVKPPFRITIRDLTRASAVEVSMLCRRDASYLSLNDPISDRTVYTTSTPLPEPEPEIVYAIGTWLLGIESIRTHYGV
jgi:hypothetical protein